MVGPSYPEKEASHPISTQERIRKTTHKYGIEIPTSVEHALNLTGRMAITYGRMLLRWKCTTLVLHLKSQRTGKLHLLDTPMYQVTILVYEDGLHNESKMGPGWSQDT